MGTDEEIITGKQQAEEIKRTC